MEGDNAEPASLNNKDVLDSTISMFVFYVWGVLLLEEGELAGGGKAQPDILICVSALVSHSIRAFPS